MAVEFPPPGYIPAPSRVDGIEIYQPAPQTPVSREAVVGFHCPQCGAQTAYSVEDGGVKCSHCGYYEPPKQAVVGKAAQEFEFKVETMTRVAHGWGTERLELVCQKCGAQATLSQGALTHSCAFCGSNKVIQREAPQDVLRPWFLVPYQKTPENCMQIAREWVVGHWLVPKELRMMASFGVFVPVFLPYWTFDSHSAAAWKAEVGHTETERYYDASSKEWKTRTVIRWRWESGKVNLVFDDLIVPGTQRLSRLLLAQAGDFDMTYLTPYEPGYLAGMQALSYDIPLDQAWEAGREQMREQTRQACLGQASTSMVRSFTMTLNFSEESWRYILLPVYINAYSFSGKDYQVIVNGQTGAIAGQRPVNWTKLWWVIAALLAPGVLLALIGLPLVLLAGTGVFVGGLGFVLLLVGLGISIYLYQDANKLDDL